MKGDERHVYGFYKAFQQMGIGALGCAILMQLMEYICMMSIMWQQWNKNVDDIYQDHY